jgi:hypothetical protein
MGAYSGNVASMSADELSEALEQLAENWRKEPYLSNDHSEGLRYNELIRALKERFDQHVHIVAEADSTDYRVRAIRR